MLTNSGQRTGCGEAAQTARPTTDGSRVLATAAVAPLSGAAAATLAGLNGWCAAYLAGCARLVGSLPFAQIRSGRAAAALGGGLLIGAAYAWRRWRPS